MAMSWLRKIGRLFVIKTRFEAYAVTYAIAVGAVERGFHYTQMIPGNSGWILFAACLGVPFIAGAKLLDSVRKPQAISIVAKGHIVPRRRKTPRVTISRNRPRALRPTRGSASPSPRHTS